MRDIYLVSTAVTMGLKLKPSVIVSKIHEWYLSIHEPPGREPALRGPGLRLRGG